MAVSIAPPITYKRLVAAGNDELFYEDIMAAGTMVELVAANGDIDTTDELNIFEAYQKVFVVNGQNFKVADFTNTKLTITALTTAPTRLSVVTQATSNATMVVDFVNTAKTEIYGKTTAGTFVTTGGYTLSGGGMDPETRVPSAVVEAMDPHPHWYDYTVYPGGSTGALPAQAYIGCLYQGRVVLSGDSDYPHQWYMARQTDPFDYAYITGGTDAQSPIYGGAADAGECGDIVRSLIPYRDEYLIFGCATSMWYLTGNPAQGGEIMELDLTVGIFGANSYCFDGGGNLYFWGTNGLYKVTMPGQPRCVSAIPLPAIVRDADADITTHRITLAYDITRSGILVCITKLADGSNLNYFYDLKTETQDKAGGFFPETYPDQCGPYSLFYYPANDPANRDLLVGSKDGYIRKFSPTANDDDIGGSDQAINSYVTFGPLKLGEENKEGVVSSVVVETAGGQSGGGLTDSSPPTLNMWVGLSADEISEKLVANTSPNLAATIAAPGRNRGAGIKRPLRGAYAGIRVGNSTATETWGLERIVLEGKKAGRIK